MSTSPRKRQFSVNGENSVDLISEGKARGGLPSQQGMDRVAAEARACMEINYVGTVLALACFVCQSPSTAKQAEE